VTTLETEVLDDAQKPERYRMSASLPSWWKASGRQAGVRRT
jgi:hypothetical protein